MRRPCGELKQVRASFDNTTVTVYQAYSNEIADVAISTGTFEPPFKFNRMTWIKPSFLWTMHRSGWATKPGQERVLAIRLTRTGFDEALGASCLTSFDPAADASSAIWKARLSDCPVRVQWDPDRSFEGAALASRTIQIGLGPAIVPRYVADWIAGIDDLTPDLRGIRLGLSPVPEEAPYPVARPIRAKLGMDPRTEAQIEEIEAEPQRDDGA